MTDYPCPLCKARVQEVLERAHPNDGHAAKRAAWLCTLARWPTPRSRAEHLARVHNWKLPPPKFKSAEVGK